jgi:deazaflavin-dependent oxidoreductase (nitroreductase family)
MSALHAIDSPAAGAPEALGDLARCLPGLTRRMSATHAALLLHAQWCIPTRWFGSNVLVLETVGRHSGRPRATPLVYLPHGSDLAVVPANAGADRAPAWWLNLQAAGQGTAVLGSERRLIVPSIVTGAERERLWEQFRSATPLEHYQRRSRRKLPIVVLARAEDAEGDRRGQADGFSGVLASGATIARRSASRDGWVRSARGGARRWRRHRETAG